MQPARSLLGRHIGRVDPVADFGCAQVGHHRHGFDCDK
jgi:hypothetical protein